MKPNTKKLTLISLLSCLALILSFLETLLPPVYSAAPGIKIGLPNVIIMFALYKLGVKEAALISFIRILLASLLFGSAISLAYSIAGGLLSLTIMYLIKRINILSAATISVIGAVCHNLAQICVAAVIMNTKELFAYLPLLCIGGILSGILVGLITSLLIKKIKSI